MDGMNRLFDYLIQDKIAENPRSVIYRAKKDGSSDHVIIKLLKQDNPAPVKLARFRQEYERIRRLDLEGVVNTFEIIEHSGGFALILEDFGGVPLSVYREGGFFNISRFLDIAVKITGILRQIHGKNVLHRDLKPSNILINPDTGAVKITDFGLSADITSGPGELDGTESALGTIAYMSPEQTGRMNRTMDARSDLYSLGVIFYELLTGTVPFFSRDPVEVVHGHLARKPVPPGELNPSVPPPINDMVMKLLEKAPENRYQSCGGLLSDLIQCRKLSGEQGGLEGFLIGASDIPETLSLPATLYGRESLFATIMAGSNTARRGGKSLILIEGTRGSGKTAVMQEIRGRLSRESCFLLSGESGPGGTIPYGHLINSVRDLVRELLTEPKEKLELWRSMLSSALGAQGRVLTEMVPDIEKITGPQPELPRLGMEEGLNRFIFVFKNFLSVFLREKPVILLLDDFHDADLPTYSLIQSLLLDPSIGHLMVAATYRDDAVDRSHRLKIMESIVAGSGVEVDIIALTPLSEQNVRGFIESALRRSDEGTAALASAVHGKTGGNPFFLHQFLLSLFRDGILSVDFDRGWIWDMEAIRTTAVTDNVADLLAARIDHLPEPARETLTYAACMGRRFDIDMLVKLTGRPVSAIIADLEPALVEEIIEPIGPRFQFRHNRIHETVCLLIPDETSGRIHLAIGRAMNDDLVGDGDEREDTLYHIVNHMNRGAAFIDGNEDRIVLAGLNRKAAMKSHASAAYDAALNYAVTGMSLLPPDSWNSHYRLSIDLHLLRAQCEYITSSFSEAEKYFDETIAHSRSAGEKARIHIDKSQLFLGMGNHRKAIKEALKGLGHLGITLPRKPGYRHILCGIVTVRMARAFRTIRNLEELKSLKSKNMMIAMELLLQLAYSSYFVNTKLMSLAVLLMVRITLRHGNSSYSGFAYSMYGMIIGYILGDRTGGYRFGLLSLRINNRFFNPSVHYKTTSAFALFLNHWKSHTATCMEYFEKAYTRAREAGDLSFAGYLASWMSWTSFILGERLDLFEQRCRGYMSFFEQFKSGNEYVIYAFQGYVLNLSGVAPQPGNLSNGLFNEEIFGRVTNKTLLYSFYLCKSHLSILFGNYRQGLKMVEKMRENSNGVLGLPILPHLYFFSALVYAVLIGEKTAERRRFRREFRRNLGELKKLSAQSPVNWLHMHLLAEAEHARLKGRILKAQDLYDRSIEAARAGKFIHDEALACETAARFYMSRGKKNTARAYLSDARSSYLRWGATGKVRDLDDLFPELLISARAEQPPESSPEMTGDDSSSGNRIAGFDLMAALRLSMEISSDIHLDNLMMNIMKIILMNAGAERGVLILARNDELRIEIEGGTGEGSLSTRESIPVEGSGFVPETIIRYVERTRDTVILDNAAAKGLFAGDPYVLQHRTKSVLALPLVRNDVLEGIIYLENNVAENAFRRDRVQVLQILGTQAAVSLQNAVLFERTHEAEQKLTRQYEEIQSQYEELEAMNEVLTRTHEELHDAGSEMERMRNFLQNIIDYMPSIIIGIDIERRINHWNREAVRFTGIGSGEAAGRLVDEIIGYFREGEDLIARAVEEKTAQKAEKVRNLIGNGMRFYDIVVYPLSGIYGEGAVIRIDDVTARVNIESIIVQTEKMMSVGGLAAGMAHEINNPLSAILMSAQNLVRRISPEFKANRDAAEQLGTGLDTIRAYMEKRGLLGMIDGIMEMGSRASKIVEHMLAYSRKSDSKKNPVDLSELVTRTVDLASKDYDLAKKYDFRHIRIVREFSADVPPVSCVDTEIEQVLLNLFKNAAQAMTSETGRTVDPMITIRLFRNADTVQLEIEDNGPGMTQEQTRRAFEPFFTTKKTGVGTGLGLSVSYFIITENHGGTMRVQSAPGEGARFIIRFPL